MILVVKILAACGLDLLVGDPRWVPHPVRMMGQIISAYERVVLRWMRSRVSHHVMGGMLALGLPSLCYVSVEWFIQVTAQLHAWMGHVVWIIIGYTSLGCSRSC